MRDQRAAEQNLRQMIHALPDRLLHGFACDCAARALQRERREGREPAQIVWGVLDAKRRWLDGQLDGRALWLAKWRLHHRERSQVLSHDLAIDAVFWAAEQERFVEWFSSHVHNAFVVCAEKTRIHAGRPGSEAYMDELLWQVSRLRILVQESLSSKHPPQGWKKLLEECEIPLF